jgi:2-keto-4-pentenoate hydratase/2-oxohepta-3-ene-1,7-dioic acid hydratase in catechol pathway
MRLATFEVDAQRHIGVANGEGRIIDVSDIVGDDVIRLICQAEHMLPQLVPALASDQFPSYSEQDIRWLPPVPAPGKICGIAMNNSATDERTFGVPDHPVFFLKPSSCLVGHREPVRLRPYYGSVHPEPGLAVVIGKSARDVDAVDAGDYIFGYTMFNDITGDEMFDDDLPYAGRCKGSDTFGCMGPWLVTADEVADPDNLDVQCAAGGDTVSEDNTRNNSFKVPELVSFISQFQTLAPGDVISCGTVREPAANGESAREANIQQATGPVDVHIEGLGMLSNPVIVEECGIGNWRLPRQA